MKENKQELWERAVREGLLAERPFEEWRLDEPIPLWQALELMLSLLDKINPPGRSYD